MKTKEQTNILDFITPHLLMSLLLNFHSTLLP